MEWAYMLSLVVLVMSVFHCDAQVAPNPPFGFTFQQNLKESLSVMVVAFFSALAFMAIFSLYLRHCSYDYDSINRNPIAAAAELCSRGFNRQVIEKCPILIYSTVKDLKIGKGALECAVCLSEFQDHDEIRLLPKCHHVFHPHCIDAWLLSHMNCPVCRARLTSDITNIALAIPMLTSNTENNPTTRPESGRGHEMEHEHEHQQHVVCNNQDEEVEGQSSTVTRSGVTAEEPNTVVRQTFPPRESRKTLDKFPRSHSTGHSLVEPEENVKLVDRYTLRLPEHVRKHILVLNHGRVRGLTTSDVVLPGAWSSKRAWYRSNNNMEPWSSFSMTPPFVSSGWRGWGERTCWTPLRMSFYRAEGAQKPSPVLPV